VLASETDIRGVGIKWVNDVLVGNAKIAGVLTHTSWKGDQVGAIVYGVGLNIEVTPKIASDAAVHSATCVAEQSSGARLNKFTLSLLEALSRRTLQWSEGGDRAIVDTYRERSLVIGKEVEVLADPRSGGTPSSPQVLRRGRVMALDDELQLYLDDDPGQPVRDGRLKLIGGL
jgi:BirA family biotin operon repressor/biotin-[acetyl-CoA-carboxylase] ligase